jgi:hypothetical protein
MRWGLAAMAVLILSGRPALAQCDLNQLVGYTLVFKKTIDSYIEDGKRTHGFAGCTRDRVLVFADHTGVRCMETSVKTDNRPTAYLFAKSNSDMKLCVDNDLYTVAPAN